MQQLKVSPVPLHKRKLSETSLSKWGAGTTEYKGREYMAFTYRDREGTVQGYKLRGKEKKDMVSVGSITGTLYGANLWRDGGKRIIVTEGEYDAMSVSQALDHKWPVVSIPNGTSGARKAVAKNLEWLEGYEEVVFMFDMDEPGQKAAKECAELMSPGRGKIASLPLKDPSDMLQAGRVKELTDSQWSARIHRPDGIVRGEEVWQAMTAEDNSVSLPYPWASWDEKTMGMRTGELVTVVAGTGVGKSAALREVAYHLVQLGQTVGYIALEESVKVTALAMAGLHCNTPLRIHGAQAVPEETLREAYEAAVAPMYLYDHFGSMESASLLGKVKYLAKACDCRWIFLDHLSIVVSGQELEDERRGIDKIMTQLRSLVEETGVGLFLVSHLKRRDGRAHEVGGEITLADLRGSQAIAQLSDIVIGLERNQQDEENPNVSTVRVLKNRFSGDTGIGGYLKYSKETGRLSETSLDVQGFDDLPSESITIEGMPGEDF